MPGLMSTPSMVQLTQQMLQLQSLPILLLGAEETPYILRSLLEQAGGRYAGMQALYVPAGLVSACAVCIPHRGRWHLRA